jgi:hypothetical protein
MDNFSNQNSLIFKTGLNFSNNFNTNSQKKKEDSIFYIQCDICLQYPIIGPKYTCLICDDIIFCSECENTHNHPVIKFKTPEISSKEDICNLILNNSTTNKKSFKEIFLSKQNFLSKINFLSVNKYKVDFHMISDSYFIKKNSTYHIPITISNEGSISLPQDTFIYVKNCRDLYFSQMKVGKLFSPNEKLNLEMECITNERQDEYELELHIYQREIKIDYNPLKFKIKVVENLYEEDPNIFRSVVSFSPEDTVSTLPGYKKEVLSEIIRRNLSNKDILEICKILDKFDWKLTDEAIKLI